jgi:hypothetical protein
VMLRGFVGELLVVLVGHVVADDAADRCAG